MRDLLLMMTGGQAKWVSVSVTSASAGKNVGNLSYLRSRIRLV